MHNGTKIKELRKKRHMTQEELGELLGVKKAAIQKYEKGEIINLKVATIRRLCEIFHVHASELIFPDAGDLDEMYNADKLQFEVKVIESIEKLYGTRAVEIMSTFTTLNDIGQTKVIDFTYDLSLLPKYMRKSSR